MVITAAAPISRIAPQQSLIRLITSTKPHLPFCKKILSSVSLYRQPAINSFSTQPTLHQTTPNPYASPPAMGKRKTNGEYNDFIDGEKLRDNVDIRTSLQGGPSITRHISPPRIRQDTKGRGNGKGGKGGSKKPGPLTHFLCLPLVNEASRPQLETGLAKLKQDLANTGVVSLKAVRPVGTLHLTLGVMRHDKAKLGHATQYLEDLDLERILRDTTAQIVAEKAAEDGAISENLNAAALPDSQALSVDLGALVPMQKPEQTSILYAEPRDASLRLLPFAEALKRKFTMEGCLVEEKRSLRLHATVINTVYAKPKIGRGRKVDHLSGEVKGYSLPGKARGQHDGNVDDDDEDGASTAGSTHETEEPSPTSAPPDPSTAETEVAVSAKQLDGADGHGPNAKSLMRFDAREMIEKYKDVVWAKDVRIDRVQICKMGAKKILNEEGEIVAEEYEVVAEKII
jgi:activating signal cointegrator complex subunit 1